MVRERPFLDAWFWRERQVIARFHSARRKVLRGHFHMHREHSAQVFQ